MAQSEDLEVESGMQARQCSEHRPKGDQHGHHREESLSLTAGKFNGLNTYGVFRRTARNRRVALSALWRILPRD
jgi:hypothetical protein